MALNRLRLGFVWDSVGDGIMGEDWVGYQVFAGRMNQDELRLF